MRRKEQVSNPLSVVLQLVGAKWKFLIIQELLIKDLRFAEIKKKLGCTSKVLTAALRELESDGVVIREEQEGKSLKVKYYLTDIGYTLRPVIESMQKWGREYKKLKHLMEKYSNESNLSGTQRI